LPRPIFHCRDFSVRREKPLHFIQAFSGFAESGFFLSTRKTPSFHWTRAPDCAGQRAGLNEIEMKTETETDERRIEAKDQGFLEE